MTSVKNFRVDDEPTAQTLGTGAFVFTDRYSVFDWGEMPDHLPGKGKSLCVMGAYHFEKLEQEGIPHHYRGVLDSDSYVRLAEATAPPDTMGINLTQVPELPHGGEGYDYGAFFDAGGDNYLIPLEIVFRNHVPSGSSLRQRKRPRDVGLDRDDWPEGTVELPEPIVEFSTKYEEQDRYLDQAEASKLAGKAELDRLEELAKSVNDVINRAADKAGFRHHDGKIECLYYQGEIRVADVVGTFDENRFSLEGLSLSKEFLREYYRSHQPEWYRSIRNAKQEARRSENPEWKSFCEVSPEPLPDRLSTLASQLYRAGANAYTGREWFEDVPELDRVVRAIQSFS